MKIESLLNNFPVIRKIEISDKISKHLNSPLLNYTFDQVNFSHLFKTQNRQVTINSIRKHFNSRIDSVEYFLQEAGENFANRAVFDKSNFDGNYSLPFSKPIEDGVGECLEMSVVYQLLRQNKEKVYFVKGYVDSQTHSGPHAWNLILNAKMTYLIDLALSRDQEKGIFPFNSITPKGEIILKRQKRKYTLSKNICETKN